MKQRSGPERASEIVEEGTRLFRARKQKVIPQANPRLRRIVCHRTIDKSSRHPVLRTTPGSSGVRSTAGDVDRQSVLRYPKKVWRAILLLLRYRSALFSGVRPGAGPAVPADSSVE